MRLAAQAKGGYYPTPPRVVDMIAGLIQTSSGSYYRSHFTVFLRLTLSHNVPISKLN